MEQKDTRMKVAKPVIWKHFVETKGKEMAPTEGARLGENENAKHKRIEHRMKIIDEIDDLVPTFDAYTNYVEKTDIQWDMQNVEMSDEMEKQFANIESALDSQNFQAKSTPKRKTTECVQMITRANAKEVQQLISDEIDRLFEANADTDTESRGRAEGQALAVRGDRIARMGLGNKLDCCYVFNVSFEGLDRTDGQSNDMSGKHYHVSDASFASDKESDFADEYEILRPTSNASGSAKEVEEETWRSP